MHAAVQAKILEEVHKQYVMHQCFKAVAYMHSAELVHRDLKPANLLLNAECLLKVADFGLARCVTQQPVDNGSFTNAVMTDYIATRWYRAPEILVGSNEYGKAGDLWSLGCILAEMLGGRPIFTGTTTLNQLEKCASSSPCQQLAQREARVWRCTAALRAPLALLQRTAVLCRPLRVCSAGVQVSLTHCVRARSRSLQDR